MHYAREASHIMAAARSANPIRVYWGAMELSPGDNVTFIGCEIIHREACHLAACSPFQVDLAFQRKGLHDLETGQMLAMLQQAVDDAAAEDRYKAILLGYARCNDGVAGLRAPSIPMVIPKAHDCITLFFGGREAYREYFDAYPGTYFHTTGWIERDDPNVPGQLGVMDHLGLGDSYEQMVAKYGADNAQFIQDMLGDWRTNYTRLCYIRMGVTDEQRFIEESQAEAARHGWEFDLRTGDLSLLARLFGGDWDDDFLIVPPGKSIIGRNDDQVLGLAD
jgi:hypothetical protein